MELALDTSALPPANRTGNVVKPKGKRRTRPQMLTRDELDGRTNAAKLYDRIVAEVERDLAGPENLSAIERSLVQAFAGATITMHNLNTRLLLGEEIDFMQHCASVSAMVRVASRLGLQRRAKEVSWRDQWINEAAEPDNAPVTTAKSPQGHSAADTTAVVNAENASAGNPVGEISQLDAEGDDDA